MKEKHGTQSGMDAKDASWMCTADWSGTWEDGTGALQQEVRWQKLVVAS